MTDWTDIPDTSIEPGKPARSVDALALRDNPIAIAEGASGAPRIQNSALSQHPWGAEDFQTGTAERDWVLARTSGAQAGVVGSYVFAHPGESGGGTVDYDFGDTISGGLLQPCGIEEGSALFYENGNVSGTWRCMGASKRPADPTAEEPYATLWLRIS